MNREIKFRFWDENEKNFWDWEEALEAFENGFIPRKFFDYDHIIPLQYTGLKDKNGKEIYEGDILKWLYTWETYHPDGEDYDENSKEELGEVVFEFQQWRVNGKALNLHKLKKYGLEIIGNIYENPELLTP